MIISFLNKLFFHYINMTKVYCAISKIISSKIFTTIQLPSFKCSVVGEFADPLLRQLDEAERIAGETGILMNSKQEWVRPAGFNHLVERM